MTVRAAWFAATGLIAIAAPAREIQPFLDSYCIQCHGPQVKMADRSFASLESDLTSLDTLEQWQDILDRLNLSAMPPEGAKQPSDEERRAVIELMTERVTAAGARLKSTGARTPLRRLNRFEYNRTIRDLLSLQDLLADPTDIFPPDTVEHGFDNIGAALRTSDFLLDGYLSAAEVFIDAAVATGGVPKPKRYAFKALFHPNRSRPDSQDLPGHYQHIRKNTSDRGGFLWLEDFLEGVPRSGHYKVRFKAQAVNRVYPYDEAIVGARKDEPLRVAVIASSSRYGNLEFRTPSDRQVAEFEIADEPAWYEARIWLDKGYQPRLTFPNGPIRVKPLKKPLVMNYPDTFLGFIRENVITEGPINDQTIAEAYSPGAINRRGRGWAAFFREYQGPRIRVYEIEIEGPLYEEWPPASHVALFGDLEPRLENARAILERFASRAYRRPAQPGEIAPLLALVNARAESGDRPLEAIKTGLRAILSSPSFLYLNEGDGPLDNATLASRLSYFLWSSMPDDQLLAVDLQAPGALRSAALRMLSDPKAKAFARQFTSRWLELYKIGSMPPSAKDFKQYYVEGLEEAMKTEAQLFFEHLLERNLPIDRFLDADFAIVNSSLARLYGIDGVHGPQFRRVAIDDPRRGGLLGMAAVMTASANGIDTSPVVRGVWLLENVLGRPPSPPPPDVEALEPDIRGATTIRDQLIRHREVPSCNACHQHIDPLGFALESFDPIGGWRQHYPHRGRSKPLIDPSGVLPSGEAFQDITDLKRILVENHGDQFARNLTEKLLTYATGRLLERSDKASVDGIVEMLEREGGGLRDLVLLVVESDAFRRN